MPGRMCRKRSVVMIKQLLEGKPLRHPLHPLLVHAPIALFTLSLVLDVVSYLVPMEGFYSGAFYCIVGGVITALLAAIPGFVDFTSIRRDHPAKKKAIWHMSLNLLMVAIYAVDGWIRYQDLYPLKTPSLPFALSIAAFAILSVSGYLGGAMIYEDGIAVGRHRRKTPTPQEILGIAIPPDRTGNSSRLIPILDVDALHEGETLRVEIGNVIMVIAKSNGEVFAFQEFCTHRYGPLSDGRIENGTVQCPWHRSCFEMRTGKVLHGPVKVDLKTFPVEVHDGKICIALSSVASTASTR